MKSKSFSALDAIATFYIGNELLGEKIMALVGTRAYKSPLLY